MFILLLLLAILCFYLIAISCVNTHEAGIAIIIGTVIVEPMIPEMDVVRIDFFLQRGTNLLSIGCRGGAALMITDMHEVLTFISRDASELWRAISIIEYHVIAEVILLHGFLPI